ncbi:hypothetical protein [Bacillus sp. 3255]|uniref:hypothetical protein n=1 Tax=Bacillus sp. 3255 TaxID=2817904 RepID=UPI00285EA734|nr:hypothetical protein [Bacillus sp. 3255]MDR6883078.1 hypothetical protein [Bacillus sp. 3255]
MVGFFTLLLFVCFIAIIVGLIKPKAVIFWGKAEKKTRGKVLLTYILGMIACFILVGVSAPKTDSEPALSQNKDAVTVKSEEEKDKNPTWNVKDLHADKNGNLALGVKMLKATGDIPQGAEVPAEDVLKTPWNYYGKPIKFTGTIGIVQDYPPGSDFVKSGVLSQVVFTATDGTIIDLFSTVASGKLKVGNQLTLVAYPVGHVEVENKLGGKTTQLAVVTNKVE